MHDSQASLATLVYVLWITLILASAALGSLAAFSPRLFEHLDNLLRPASDEPLHYLASLKRPLGALTVTVAGIHTYLFFLA